MHLKPKNKCGERIPPQISNDPAETTAHDPLRKTHNPRLTMTLIQNGLNAHACFVNR